MPWYSDGCCKSCQRVIKLRPAMKSPTSELQTYNWMTLLGTPTPQGVPQDPDRFGARTQQMHVGSHTRTCNAPSSQAGMQAAVADKPHRLCMRQHLSCKTNCDLCTCRLHRSALAASILLVWRAPGGSMTDTLRFCSWCTRGCSCRLWLHQEGPLAPTQTSPNHAPVA